jgi:hypothetical protein
VYSEFHSEDELSQWICWDFKTLRIEPTHYTIQTYGGGPNWSHLKSWAVEGSDDGSSWTEIHRRENNSDLNGRRAVKTFAVSRAGSFRRICLRQTGPNHAGNNHLVLDAFELFGAVAGLPSTVSVKRFLRRLQFTLVARQHLQSLEEKQSDQLRRQLLRLCRVLHPQDRRQETAEVLVLDTRD